ncbi:hypothetical protein SCLCIDRAFT_135027, partial [Scleroderma citrinum Foug A]
GWKLIFLDIFWEHWAWFASVSSTLPPIFLDLLQEALQRCSLHPGFTLEDMPFILPNSGPAQTRSDCVDFINAFKIAMSNMLKIFNNYCYAQRKDLLINIPSEHFSGLLRTSIHPVPPDISDYIWSAIEWDPRWSYSIFHTFDMAQNNINWFENSFVKAYLRTAMNPNSRGWLGVAIYTQGLDSTGSWRAVSQPNVEFLSWMMAWFIIDLHADTLRQNTWEQCHVTPARLKAVCAIQGRLKHFIDSVLAFHLPGLPLDEMFHTWRGLHQFLNF